MEATAIVLISLLAVVVSGFLARLSRLALPLVQIALGAAIHYSGISSVVLDPELFFLLFLPPLLFLDGWRIPRDALFRDAATILRLALGLVVFTVLGIGLLIHWLIPAMPLAVAFALAAVISPTDPIAVSAIAARTPIPRRLMHVLQGEALLNDASGLVCMRFAVAAALTGSFSLGAALGNFVWIAAGGLAIGAGITWLIARTMSWAALRFGEDGGAQILVTLLIPFGVYIVAERLHCSGILAVVAAGVMMGVSENRQTRAATRLRRTAVWDMVRLTVNGSVFVLLGQQIPDLLAAAPQTVLATAHSDPWWLLHYVLVIVVALGVLRFGWVWLWASVRLGFIGRLGGAGRPAVSRWRLVLATTLAGVRGAVTLAGVLTLPVLAADGAAFPARDLAISLAAGVIVVSLLIASLAFPHSLRGVELPPEGSQQVAEDRARMAAAAAAVLAIEDAARTLGTGRADAWLYGDAASRLVDLYRQRLDRYAGDDDPSIRRGRDDAIEAQFRVVGLRAERAELLARGHDHGIDDLTLRKLVRELDFREARHAG